MNDHSILLDVLQEIHATPRDEYGLKAKGLLLSLEKFDTFFGLKLAYLLFGASEEVSKTLQSKDLSLQEAVSSVKLASSFYKRQRTNNAFSFFMMVLSSQPKFTSPLSFYRKLYFEACDVMIQELQDRFDEQQVLHIVLAVVSLVLKAVNGEDFQSSLEKVKSSRFQDDLNFDILNRQLPIVVDIIKEGWPQNHHPSQPKSCKFSRHHPKLKQ